MTTKQARQTHIDMVRDGATSILSTIDKLNALRETWDAGMGTWITDGTDFDGLEGIDKDSITAVYTTFEAINALMATGHRTNLEKVRK